MAKFLEAYPIKVKAPEREPGSILRRTDFEYMNGHGTFYQFDINHFPDNFLDAKEGDIIKLVLYNLHTDQLDEVVFTLRSRFNVGEKYIYFIGQIDDIADYWEIEIDYYLDRPLESYILVCASAPPDYGCYFRAYT